MFNFCLNKFCPRLFSVACQNIDQLTHKNVVTLLCPKKVFSKPEMSL